jgi:hypothetical protein
MCNEDTCIANSNSSSLYKNIQERYYSCTGVNNIKRVQDVKCYHTIISFFPQVYQLKRCDSFDYEKQIPKEISDDPDLCTINPIPYFTESMDSDNHTYAGDLYTQIHNLAHTSKIKLENEIQTLAVAINAYAIDNYTEKIISMPEKKCNMRRYGRAIMRRCRMTKHNYLQITFRFIFM